VLEILTDDGDTLSGKYAAEELIKDWDLDMRKGGKAPIRKEQTGKVDYRTKKVHNIVLSMPDGTPPPAVLKAAERFARENFAFSHRYAMVRHDPATDPKYEKTQSGRNPHVHLVVKAVSERGERLLIKKTTLQHWRQQFAQALREQGVRANATPAAIRGKPKSNSKSAIYKHQKRLDTWRTKAERGETVKPAPIESAWEIARVSRVLEELINGTPPDLAGKTRLQSTRLSVINDWFTTEKELRAAGKGQDADRVRDLSTVCGLSKPRMRKPKTTCRQIRTGLRWRLAA
jgi:hypothetical protein